MITVYLYVTDTMADWEIGHLTAEVNSRRFFRKDALEVVLKTVALGSEPVKTMGGITVLPDCTFDNTEFSAEDYLVLPGADTWSDPKHAPVIDLAVKHISAGGTVCAICGATLALAFTGILNEYRHTSNGPGFLDMFCPTYSAAFNYVDAPAVADGNLITAGSAGGLQWAYLILEKLGVLSDEALAAWKEYFSSGSMGPFFALMDAVKKSKA